MRDYSTPQVSLCSMKLATRVLYHLRSAAILQKCTEWDIFFQNRIYNRKYKKQGTLDMGKISLSASQKFYS